MECVMMGLRLAEGIPFTRIEAIAGKTVADVFDPVKIVSLVNEGYLMMDNARIIATAAGRQRLNSLLGYLLA